MGALLAHVTGGHIDAGRIDVGPGAFQPMNVNFGLFPPLDAPSHGPDGKRLKGEERGRARKRLLAERALQDLERWRAENAAA
ncbi:MAG: hypothetical protein EBZ50_01935 [Alphaproteobacteria bacterium]|nr:hypothetical protein [Alphaproteobacteria bacterium]